MIVTIDNIKEPNMKNVLEVFILFISIKSSTQQCSDSKKTMEYVPSCPRSRAEWNAASDFKKCANVQQTCVQQSEFVYHCVINTYLNATVEVCAPAVDILGQKCAEYNTGGERIQEHSKTNCSTCPFRYLSSDSYLYQECYRIIHSNVTLSNDNSNCDSKIRESEEDNPYVAATWVLFSILVIIVFIIVVRCIRSRKS
ncbi:uncharacterized protein LOC134254181 [Saccostrea cucullata]|uniref:uncharacterized protein LOC134254181 n=1 Tax=Saccostrea cuccullata TaxID=36930 RepID=UPI002ED01617